MNRINYRIDDLRALLALAQHGSFVRAAETLFITQSAFSRRITQLEEAVGARLVERTSRRVALSALGQSLANQALIVLPQLDQSVEDAYRQAHGESGRVTLACLTTVAYSRLPTVLGQFRQTYPNVRLHVRDDTGQRVTQSVINREAEFGVTVLNGNMADLVIQRVAQDPFVVAVSPDHPLANIKTLNWRELAKWKPVGLGRSSANRDLIDSALLRAGITLPWFDEVEHLSTMIGFLRNAQVVGVLPRMALDARAPDLVMRPLTAPVLRREIALIRRPETELSQAAQELWALLARSLH
ncbi:MAG: LysR family transcriptional regulator [Pseudomonadota bacterium]